MSTEFQTRPRRSRVAARSGLVLAALLAISDGLLASQQIGDGDPFVFVMLVCTLLTAVAVPFAWRSSEMGCRTVVGTRVLSALTGLPAFFVADVPGVGVVMAAVGIVLALVVAVLVYPGSRQGR